MSALPANLLNHSTFLTHVLETTQSGIAVLRAVVDQQQVVDFIFTYVNPTAGKIYGRPLPDPFDGPPSYLRLFPTAKVIGLFDAFVTVLKTGQPYHNSELAYAWDGVNGWFDMRVNRFEDSIVLMVVDVTDLKRTQLEQQRQANFLQELLQTSPSGIVVYEAIRSPLENSSELNGSRGRIVDFKAIFCNVAYERIVGESIERIRSVNLSQRLNEAPYQELFTLYVQLMETEQPFHFERYDAHLGKWLNMSGTQWQDGFLAIVDDVSERKEAEAVQQHQAQQLQLLNQELLRSNENLLEFSYVASHDLQEPLRKIRQFGDILGEQYAPQLGDQGLDLLGRMQAASMRMSALIRDLLDYSRLTRQPESYRHQNLNQIVDEVLTALELTVGEKEALIEVDHLGTLIGDATQLAQLFQNLLTNALKFSKSHVPPHIRISNQMVNVAHLPERFQPPGGQESFCAIRVTDNGIGFDPEQAERIFGTFQRLHGKSQYPGTGIGLAIAKKVVTNHGGYIMAESQVGQGATFTIYLPTTNPLSANDQPGY